MQRRDLLKHAIAIPLLGFLSTVQAAWLKQKLFVYAPSDLVMDQSGNYGNGPFVLGLLSCADAGRTATKMAALRRKYNFRCKLDHSSRNKWKAAYARAVIDLWLKGDDMHIDIIVAKDAGNKQRAGAVEQISDYTELLSRLIDMAPKAKDKASRRRLIAQRHFKDKRQAWFETMLRARNDRLDAIIHTSERESDLLQLVDLVVGAVQASQTTTLAPVKNATKRSLMGYLATRLGTTSLTMPLQHPRCSITFI